MKDLQNKVAFITGGASGVGLGMAKVFAAAGMKIVIADIRQDHLDEAMAHFNQTNASVHPMQLDVTNRAAMERAADEAEAVFGKVHLVCNNAGVNLFAPMDECTYQDWDWVLGVNLGGVINGVKTFVPRIKRHGEGGHIVNTSSMSGIFPHANAGLYITSKFAITGMSEVLRTELAADNIGVSVFCPGPVQTNIANSGATRPAHLAETGYAEFDKQRQARSVSPTFMDPLLVGEKVLAGIERNDLYIFTHPEFRDGMQARCNALMAAVPDETPDPDRVAAIQFLLSNPIYSKQENL